MPLLQAPARERLPVGVHQFTHFDLDLGREIEAPSAWSQQAVEKGGQASHVRRYCRGLRSGVRSQSLFSTGCWGKPKRKQAKDGWQRIAQGGTSAVVRFCGACGKMGIRRRPAAIHSADDRDISTCGQQRLTGHYPEIARIAILLLPRRGGPAALAC
jgi:hypothetical protein